MTCPSYMVNELLRVGGEGRMEVAKRNVPMRTWDRPLMLLMKCWKTNMAFLFPLKINYSNLTAKHMWTSEKGRCLQRKHLLPCCRSPSPEGGWGVKASPTHTGPSPRTGRFAGLGGPDFLVWRRSKEQALKKQPIVNTTHPWARALPARARCLSYVHSNVKHMCSTFPGCAQERHGAEAIFGDYLKSKDLSCFCLLAAY